MIRRLSAETRQCHIEIQYKICDIRRWRLFPIVGAHAEDVEDDRGQLGSDGDGRHGGGVEVVEIPQQPAAEEPGDAETGLEDAEAGAAHLLRDDLADGCLHDGFLGAHADAPEDDADDDQRRFVREEDEAGEKRAQEGGEHQGLQSRFVKEPAEEQRGEGIHRHRQGVQQAEGVHREGAGVRSVQGDQCEIREAEAEEADGDHVEDERLPHLEILLLLGLFLLEDLRVRVLDLRRDDQSDRDQCRDAERQETQPVGREELARALNF